jgi:hypothetical protein
MTTKSKITIDQDIIINLVTDVKAIKDTLTGDELHPNGIIAEIKSIKESIHNVDIEHKKWTASVIAAVNTETNERIRCDNKIEVKMAKRDSIWGSIIAIFTILLTTTVNWFIFKRFER